MAIDRLQVRRGTASEWAEANTILADGEPGYERDTGKIKYGNGTTPWGSLPYASQGEQGIPGNPGVVDDASLAALAADPDSDFRAVQNATFVRFEDENGNPLPTRNVVIKVSATTGEIIDIVSEA